MNSIDALNENMVELVKENSDLRQLNQELEEKLKWYREKWEKVIATDIANSDFLLRITDTLQESNNFIKRLKSDVDSYSKHNEEMIKILKAYSLWDKYILTAIEANGRIPPKEGPATTYLKEIGEFEVSTKGKN